MHLVGFYYKDIFLVMIISALLCKSDRKICRYPKRNALSILLPEICQELSVCLADKRVHLESLQSR